MTISPSNLTDEFVKLKQTAAARHVTPRQLDWMCNGVPVYIRRRPDGSVYATTSDLSKFVPDAPLETLRLPVGDLKDLRMWSPESDPRVIEALERHK